MKKAASRALAFPKAQVGRFGPDGLGRRKAEVQGFQDGRDKPVEVSMRAYHLVLLLNGVHGPAVCAFEKSRVDGK